VRRGIALIAAAVALPAAGCGSDEEPGTPAVCTAGADAYLEALESAPGEVRLDGETPISGCIVEEQTAGDLADVGQVLVQAATQLKADAASGRDRQAAIELGYLIGAVDAAAATTGGIHADLLRRLEAAARLTGEDGGAPAALRQGYDEGFAAGQEGG
jgi:hypothetical protein